MRIRNDDLNKAKFSDWFTTDSEEWLMLLMRNNLLYKDSIPYYTYAKDSSKYTLDKMPANPYIALKSKGADYWYLFLNREVLMQLMVLPPFDTAAKKFRALSWKEDLLRLRVASLLYERNNKSLPSSIRSLVPDYIDSIPRDMYVDQEVTYLADKALFYVCGPDLKDDGGRYTKAEMKNLDYVGDVVQFIHCFPEEEGK